MHTQLLLYCEYFANKKHMFNFHSSLICEI